MYKILPILLFAYSLALTTEDIYDNSYALIIGIDKYDNVSNLDYAVRDANSIASLLKDNFNFPAKNVKVLINDEATYSNIRNNLDEISSFEGGRITAMGGGPIVFARWMMIAILVILFNKNKYSKYL